MNNVYGLRELYTIRGDMCYDNKMMMNTAISERTPPPPQSVVALNITELDKNRTHESTQHLQEQPQQDQHTKKSSLLRLRSRLRCNILLDVVILTIVCTILLLIEFGFVPHTRLGFICKDPKISYPFRGDTITSTNLLIGTIVGQLFMIVLVEIIREKSFKRVCPGTVWYYFKEGCIGAILMLLLTQIIKILVGEPRPHFFDSCEPDANQYCQPGTFIIDYNCTNKALSHFFRVDIERSFPSGHTCVSTFVSLYCAYLIQVRLRESRITQITKSILIVVCLLWTIVCSFSRITDRRHHWWDVLAGAILGICGVFYTITLIRNKTENRNNLMRSNTSTTLLDVKNKDATSVMI